MKEEQSIAYINADCQRVMSIEDLEILKIAFESFSWDGLRTFKLMIPFNSIYKMIQSSYKVPNLYDVKDSREEVRKLESYLPVVTIETLSYFEYCGEKIYGCIKYDLEEEETFFERTNANDLYKLMTGIEKYLKKNTIDNHEIIKEKVIKLKVLSEVAQRYNLEIFLIDEYL